MFQDKTKMIFSVWGPSKTEADTLVNGREQPMFINGEKDHSASVFHYTIEANSFEEAKKEFLIRQN